MPGVFEYNNKFATAVTGNTNSPPGKSTGCGKQTVVCKFTAGTTVAVAIQGSFAASPSGADWVTLVCTKEGTAAETKAISFTETTTGYAYYVISKGWWPYVRVNLSANTGMSLDEAWLLEQGA